MSRTIRVLHVDDDPAVRELTEDMLESEGEDIVVESARSGPDAVSLLKGNGRVDCIVCDYGMSEMDGLELLEAVREFDAGVPFILFTGKGSEEIASRAISAGATEYLQKGSGTDQYALLANRVENAVERRRAELEHRRARNRYQAIIEASSDLIAILDEDGRFQYASPATRDAIGFEPSTLEGESAFERIHPDDESDVADAFDRMVENPSATPSVRYRLKHADGDWRHLESRGANRLGDPAVEGIVVNTRDVTDRVEVERELTAEREFFDAALDALPHVFYVANLDGSGWRWNRKLEEVSGYSAAELADIDVTEIFADEDLRNVESVIQRVKDGETVVYEATMVTKSGERKPRRISASLLEDDDGEPLGICGIGMPAE